MKKEEVYQIVFAAALLAFVIHEKAAQRRELAVMAQKLSYSEVWVELLRNERMLKSQSLVPMEPGLFWEPTLNGYSSVQTNLGLDALITNWHWWHDTNYDVSWKRDPATGLMWDPYQHCRAEVGKRLGGDSRNPFEDIRWEFMKWRKHFIETDGGNKRPPRF